MAKLYRVSVDDVRGNGVSISGNVVKEKTEENGRLCEKATLLLDSGYEVVLFFEKE